MSFLGKLLLRLGGLLGVASLGIAWWVGLYGLYGMPGLYRWIALGVVVGSIVFVGLGLVMSAPAKGPAQPKAAKKAKGKDQAPKAH